MKFIKIIKIVVSTLFAFTLFTIPIEAANKVNTVGIYVATPSQSQIIQFVNNHSILSDTNSNVSYDTLPSIKIPYRAGEVSKKSLVDGLNAVNIIRYISGIPANITLDDDYTYDAQRGSIVNAINNQLSHTPDKPDNMDADLYGAGYNGTSHSNIANGYKLISSSIISGYMDDGDPSNISVVGHRRWVLNPSMQKTGFGFAPNNFSAMYAQDNASGNFDDNYAVTAYPAQNMPVEYFDKSYPFSVSLSQDFDDLNRDSIRIKMTRLSDGKIFYFNSQTSNDVNSQSYFDVDNQYCGQPHCIIWRPNIESYKKGDAFSIEISGIQKNGENYPLSYNVSFFSLKNTTSNNAKVPQISNLSFSLNTFNPKTSSVKIYVNTDVESLLYCNVYDKNNNKVATIANGAKLKYANRWYVSWNGKNSSGNYLTPGAYRIEAYLSNSNGYSKVLSKYITIN
jgi:hypothetical protein